MKSFTEYQLEGWSRNGYLIATASVEIHNSGTSSLERNYLELLPVET